MLSKLVRWCLESATIENRKGQVVESLLNLLNNLLEEIQF